MRGDGVVGHSFLAVLAGSPAGATLGLELERVDSDALHPLELAFRVNGVAAGARPVPREGSERVTLEVAGPGAVADDPYLDVLVTASNWTSDFFGGVERQKSFVFRALELAD